MKTRNLSGAVVAITGGSLGIGRATAQAFVDAGAQVAIGARNHSRADTTARQIGALAYPLDVTDPSSVEKFCRQTEDEIGPIDVFVNNAGVMLVGRFENESEQATAEQINVNLVGTLNGMKAAVPRMRTRGGGHIINMVSAVGMVGLPGCATYSAAKHGVVGLTEAVRNELRGTGINLSIILPIPARTELTSGVGKGRFVPLLEETDIAAAVLRTARRPRYHVYVPGWTNPVTRLLGLLPQSGRDAAGRLLKADQLLKTTDLTARQSYEERVRIGTRSKEA